MFFLWCQSLCMASNFILLKENEAIEAETEHLAFPGHRQYWKLKPFCIFRKREMRVVFSVSHLL